jgi:hypothetical protein
LNEFITDVSTPISKSRKLCQDPQQLAQLDNLKSESNFHDPTPDLTFNGRNLNTLNMSTTAESFDGTMDGTRRRLFPEMGFEANTLNDESSTPSLLDDGLEFNESSPTSVYEYPSLEANKKRRLVPQIAMGEDGAEVSIDLSSLFITAPSEAFESPDYRALGEYRQESLLDADCTPTPPSIKKYDMRNLCCSMMGTHQEDEYTVGPGAEIERTISSFLEDSGNVNPKSGCQGWQAWSFLLESDVATENPSRESIKSNLRSRTCNLGARKSRVRQLRKDFDPFANSPRRSPAPELVTSRSFSVADHGKGIARASKEKRKNRSSFANVLQLCTMPENATVESPLVVRHRFDSPDKEDVCYDSDPEDFTRSGRGISSHVNKENLKKDQLYKYAYPRSVNASPTGDIDDVNRDDAFKAVVQEIFNGLTTLIYHPTKVENGEVYPMRPVAVDAWLERGQRLITIIQPKWMWKPKPRDAVGVENHQLVAIKGIELLDITRILKVARVNRTYYPFAKPSNSFMIKTIDNEEFCFEAKSPVERDRLVYSLKLVIARFGAKVVMGDPNVYREFFASADGVPGEAPDLMQIGESSESVV